MTSKDDKKGRPRQALEGTRLNAFGMDPEDLVVVGFDTKDGPEHPLYDERVNLPLEESMVCNLMVHGVLEPVLVRKNGDVAEVVAGRRRVLHAREANKRLKKQGSELLRVPCFVKRGDDGALMGVSISENEIRRDDVLSAKADKLRRYLATGKSEKDAAVAFGVSHQTIKNWGKLSDLSREVVKAIENGDVPASAGYSLAELPRDEQREKLAELLKSGSTTVRAAKSATKAAKAKRNGEKTDFEPPGKRLINKVLRFNDKADVLNGDFLKGVKWVLGDIGPTSIAGLSELIREAKGEKKDAE
jgi:ParB family chromosome partitioning protein